MLHPIFNTPITHRAVKTSYFDGRAYFFGPVLTPVLPRFYANQQYAAHVSEKNLTYAVNTRETPRIFKIFAATKKQAF